MEDLGYNIGSWLAVENSSRDSAAVPYGDVTHSKQGDVMKHTAESLVTKMGCRSDWLFAGPKCQQFSSANREAKWMASTGRDLFRDVTSTYPSLKYCIENVVPKSKLREETLVAWNSTVPVQFRKPNAASVRTATSRPKMISTDMVSVAENRKKLGVDPNMFLEKGKTDRRTMPCVMTCPRVT